MHLNSDDGALMGLGDGEFLQKVTKETKVGLMGSRVGRLWRGVVNPVKTSNHQLTPDASFQPLSGILMHREWLRLASAAIC